jgi:hypothetical protein
MDEKHDDLLISHNYGVIGARWCRIGGVYRVRSLVADALRPLAAQ